MKYMADGHAPTWEHGLPFALAMAAYFTNGMAEYAFTGLTGAWIAILFAWHSGWRKVN